MNITYKIEEDYAQMSKRAADMVISQIKKKPNSFLCLATGNSPTLMYDLLAQKTNEDPYFFKQARIIKLDEWLGLPMNYKSTCETYLQEKVIKPLKISNDNYFGFISNPDNPENECKRIDEIIRNNGPIDLCVLGVGVNGHIGFNEPAEYLVPYPHVSKLAPETVHHSMLRGNSKNISFGLTLGFQNILDAGTILLLASGKTKLPVMEKLKEEKVTSQLPVSLLLLHSNTICICDKQALVS